MSNKLPSYKSFVIIVLVWRENGDIPWLKLPFVSNTREFKKYSPFALYFVFASHQQQWNILETFNIIIHYSITRCLTSKICLEDKHFNRIKIQNVYPGWQRNSFRVIMFIFRNGITMAVTKSYRIWVSNQWPARHICEGLG